MRPTSITRTTRDIGMGGFRLAARCMLLGVTTLLTLGTAGIAPSLAQVPPQLRAQRLDYDADPDQEHYTLHVQPPLAIPTMGPENFPIVPADVINGITIIDAYTSAGFDFAGEDRGNETSIAANPLAPNVVILMSFLGSNWGIGGNAALLFSSTTGATWSRPVSIPFPTGTTTNINCPCDQNPDYGRDGTLYATFLHLNTGGSVQSVYTAQTTSPAVPGTWTYRTNAGVAQKTNDPALSFVDQPWVGAGPLSTDNAVSNVAVGYDNFDGAFNFSQVKGADSPGFSPLNITRDNPINVDGQTFNDGMNPGTRIAAGPTGIVYSVFQRLVTSGTVKQLTYLVSASTNDGLSWFVANSDHVSGAKIVAANVLSFQGNGSKVGGVNALLGGITAIGVDPASGTAWVVYGQRVTAGAMDQLFLVPVTYSSGNLLVGTPRLISPVGLNAYLPSVAVLPSGEIGVLFMTYDGAGGYSWRFVQTVDGGLTLVKTTTLKTFTSPFADNGQTNQRIFGDYIQVKPVGCEFYGAFPARGAGVNSINSINPWFMRAPAATACFPPSVVSLSPSAVCQGGPTQPITVNGANLLRGATAMIQGIHRTTTYVSGTQLTSTIQAGDLVVAGSAAVRVMNPAPANGLSGTFILPIDGGPPGGPGNSLFLTKGGGNVTLTWAAGGGARNYNVNRTAFGPPWTGGLLATPTGTTHNDPVQFNGISYGYFVDAANGCGTTP